MDLEQELQKIRDHFKNTPTEELKRGLIEAGFGKEEIEDHGYEIVFPEEPQNSWSDELVFIDNYFDNTPEDIIKQDLIKAGFKFKKEDSPPKTLMSSFSEYSDFIDDYFNNTPDNIIKQDLIEAGLTEDDFLPEKTISLTNTWYVQNQNIPQIALGA